MNDLHEFRPIAVEIAQTPIPVWERVTFWLVVLVVVSAIAWLVIGQVDVVVTARGKLVPMGQTLVIQPLQTGVVRTLSVKAGDYVKQGQLLVEIEPEMTEPEVASAHDELCSLDAERQRIQALLDERPFVPRGDLGDKHVRLQQSIYNAESEKLRQQIATKGLEKEQVSKDKAAAAVSAREAGDLLAIARRKWERMEPVASLLPSKEVDSVREELTRYSSEVDKGRNQMEGLDEKSQQVESQIGELKDEFRSRLLKELHDNKQRTIELQAKLRQSKFVNARQRIMAPADGFINERFINTIGGVVQPAEKLMTLVPRSEPLWLEALAENKDVGFVRKGMQAAIKIDAFDYQKYGVLDGTVTQVSSDSIHDEKIGEVFKVMVQPAKMALNVSGKQQFVQCGMTAETEIKVGKRRIIEFFISPLTKAFDKSVKLR